MNTLIENPVRILLFMSVVHFLVWNKAPIQPNFDLIEFIIVLVLLDHLFLHFSI